MSFCARVTFRPIALLFLLFVATGCTALVDKNPSHEQPGVLVVSVDNPHQWEPGVLRVVLVREDQRYVTQMPFAAGRQPQRVATLPPGEWRMDVEVDRPGEEVLLLGSTRITLQPETSQVIRIILEGSPRPTGFRIESGVQALLDAASDGEEIVLPPGIYRESIDFRGKAVVLRSASPGDPDTVKATVLQGDGSGPVVRFASGEGPGATLEGFTIRGGRSPRGGGIFIDGSSPTIRYNAIVDNRADEYGGGLYARNSKARIAHNRIENNRVSGILGGGGGLHLQGGAPHVENNVIRRNSARYGGGMDLVGVDGALIRGNLIEANRAFAGAGLAATRASADVSDNAFGQNFSHNSTGGADAHLYASESQLHSRALAH